MAQDAKYAHGHHPSVLRSHVWRTVENSCAYLIPHLKADQAILDVGCGPGTITCDLATRVPHGSVIGLDSAASVVQQAQDRASEQGVKNVRFATGDVFKLDFDDDTFDVVHAHQVLQHLGDPVAALKEMKRVTKQGGIVAVRDMSHFLHWPVQPELEEFRELFWKISEKLGTTPGTGSMFRRFAREAGFAAKDVDVKGGTWCYANEEDLKWWCGMWADRVLLSEFHDNCIKLNLATEEDLKRISEAWKKFATHEDGWYTVVQGEMIARKS